MGYYTRYDISNNSEEIQEAINLKSGYYRVDEDSIKWYGWGEDIKHVSVLYPNTEIHVEGVGEENEDVWKAFAKDGQLYVSKAELTFGPYVKA